MTIFHLYYDLLVAGIETMLVNIANEQARAGHKVKLLILNDAIDASLLLRLDESIELVCFGKKRKSKNPFPVMKLNLYLLTHHFDMLHVHNPRLGRMIYIPISQEHKCCTQHCLCNGKLDSDYLHLFDHRFAISDAVKDDIKEKYDLDTTTIYNGIITSAFRTGGEKLSKDGKFHVVQVGRLNFAVKGQDIAVKALAKLKGRTKMDVVIDFIGDSENESYNQIAKLAKELGVEDSVNFLGLRTQEYIGHHLCEYDLFIQPSRKEGFGLTIAEAMAAKVPVLVSDVTGPMDVISNGEYGSFFAQGDENDCAEKLCEIVNGAIDIHALAEKAYRRVCELFDVNKTALNYLNCYQDIAGVDEKMISQPIENEVGNLAGGGRIVNRSLLEYYIREDFESYKMHHPLLARMTYGENWELFSYMRNLRHLEFYANKPRKYPWDMMLKAYYWLKHRWNCKHRNIYIAPNTVGSGFHLQHRGYRHILPGTRIGCNCEILPMVLMGKKQPGIKDCKIQIGNNCYISTGVTILGPVRIGDNVTIGAGAVVTKDIPSNCVVAGVPAKIIKRQE